MRQVPIFDATEIRTLQDVYKESANQATKLILSEVHSPQVLQELKGARLLFSVGKANLTNNFEEALLRSNSLLETWKN